MLEENYGAVGLGFLEKWQGLKEDLLPEFKTLQNHYIQKADGDEVLTRLSMYFAAVHFAGLVLTELLNIEIDLTLLDQLFDDMAKENKAIDKPKEWLEALLTDLDADRNFIGYSKVLPTNKTMKAIFKDGTIYLLPEYLKNFLGAEMTMIRKEWRKREYTFTFERKGNIVDYKQLKYDAKNYQVVPVSKEIVEELDFDFNDYC